MYDTYYKTPLKFKDLIEKKDLEKVSLEYSIAQFINIVITSSFGECKFNEIFGCKIWETDFDLLSDPNTLKDRIKNDVKVAIKMQENRLDLTEVEISIGNVKAASYNNSYRIKKRITIEIKGFIKKTNRDFSFITKFFVGPLSYN